MKKVKQVTFGFLGIILVMIGLTGIIIPVLPGWPLIFAGLILLSLESPIIDHYINNIVSKNKYLEHYYLKSRFWIRNRFGYEL
jgi:uncharacterized membrane protein YbaN (DUF454 family)